MSYVSKQPAFALLRPCLFQQSHRVFDPASYAGLARHQGQESEVNILDLGCGAGNSIDLFRHQAPGATWHGVDIADSPEVRARTRRDGNFATFDGIHIPYEDAFFDLIYCNQVLEHVRRPEPLLGEVVRTLKPNGFFAGAVSYLEPYHSFSIFNFTPFGLWTVLQDAGLSVAELRAGSDALSLMLRQMIGKPKWSGLLLRHSAYYMLVARPESSGTKYGNP